MIIKTELSVNVEAPVPPFATDKSVVSAKLAAVKSFTWKSANAVSVIAVTEAADVVVTALNLSSPSFQYIAALFAAPLLIIIPASISAGPELFLDNSKIGSSMVVFVVLIVVVVPSTV